MEINKEMKFKLTPLENRKAGDRVCEGNRIFTNTTRYNASNIYASSSFVSQFLLAEVNIGEGANFTRLPIRGVLHANNHFLAIFAMLQTLAENFERPAMYRTPPQFEISRGYCFTTNRYYYSLIGILTISEKSEDGGADSYMLRFENYTRDKVDGVYNVRHDILDIILNSSEDVLEVKETLEAFYTVGKSGKEKNDKQEASKEFSDGDQIQVSNRIVKTDEDKSPQFSVSSIPIFDTNRHFYDARADHAVNVFVHDIMLTLVPCGDAVADNFQFKRFVEIWDASRYLRLKVRYMLQQLLYDKITAERPNGINIFPVVIARFIDENHNMLDTILRVTEIPRSNSEDEIKWVIRFEYYDFASEIASSTENISETSISRLYQVDCIVHNAEECKLLINAFNAMDIK